MYWTGNTVQSCEIRGWGYRFRNWPNSSLFVPVKYEVPIRSLLALPLYSLLTDVKWEREGEASKGGGVKRHVPPWRKGRGRDRWGWKGEVSIWEGNAGQASRQASTRTPFTCIFANWCRVFIDSWYVYIITNTDYWDYQRLYSTKYRMNRKGLKPLSVQLAY